MTRRVLKRVRLGIALTVLGVFTAAFADFRGAVSAQPWAHALAHLQVGPALVALTTGSAALGLGLLAVAALTLAFGRVYCSTLCPLGLFQDAIARVAGWIRPRRRPLRFARANDVLRYGLLGATVVTILGGGGAIVYTHADPYSHFGRIASGLLRPVLAVANNLLAGPANGLGISALYRVEPPWPAAGVLVPAAIVLGLVLALAVWRQRLFCNTLCPVGTILGLLARGAAWRLEIDAGACTKCAACLRTCKAQCLDLRAGVIDASRCVACFNCLSACPEHGLAFRFTWRSRKRDTGSAPGSPTRGEDSAAFASRRAFLAGVVALAPAALRAADPRPAAAEPTRPVTPPGSGGFDRFLARCTGCQLCVSTCLTGVLRPAALEYGFEMMMKPRLDFGRAFCNYDCTRCGDVCPTGAIAALPLEEKKLTSLGIAEFTQRLCIVDSRGTDCAACSEHCPTKAVETVPFRENLRLPRVDEEFCIGCGACEYACPVRPQRAIAVTARAVHAHARRPVDEAPAQPPAADGFPF